MHIKTSPQGILIYVTMALYALAWIFAATRRKKPAWLFFAFGFLTALVGYVLRWIHTGHVPMQNLFEVFLLLGTLVWPVSWFCIRRLHVGGQGADIFIAVIVLFPAGFIFDAEPQHLPPVLQSPLFVPHVGVYILSYILLAKATYWACVELLGHEREPSRDLLPPERAAYIMVRAGFPLLTLGLILGSVWGKFAWGDYWDWDPKELWSLASWLVYVGYFHFRYMFGTKYRHINSIWVIMGMMVIIITLLWVNLSKLFAGMHGYAV
jgi:ABC-type transport system involved in cytochrome c biogenesis permease subunit